MAHARRGKAIGLLRRALLSIRRLFCIESGAAIGARKEKAWAGELGTWYNHNVKPEFDKVNMEIKEYTEYKEDEVTRLYTEVGWTAYTNDLPALRRGLENSLLVLAAFENDELLGLVRVVGDGFTIVLVQDILVFPEHQRKGIGSELLQEILDRYSKVRQIELATDNTPKTIAFYKSMGFSELSELGCCGFMRCL